MNNNWTKTPISWPNFPFDATDVSEFVKFNTQHGEAAKIEVGPSGMSRYPGVLFLGINIETGKGRGAALGYADDLADLFEREQIEGVKVLDAQPNAVGKSDDGSWYQFNMNFGFRWDERPN
jgi:hypothetical protein